MKFLTKTFPKLHTTITDMFEILGEKEAQEVLDARNPKSSKKAVRATRSSGTKTPKKGLSKKVCGIAYYKPLAILHNIKLYVIISCEHKLDFDVEEVEEPTEKILVDKDMLKDWFGKLI